jgi:Phycobilisome protein
MHPQIESIFDEAENRYLKPEELSFLGQYVDSIPERLETYRLIRDRELEIMQAVADQLQVEMPDEKVEHLERSIKNALLMLRYCAMGMLLNDEGLVRERLIGWLGQTMKIYNTQALDSTLYRLLNQQLSQVLNSKQMVLINSMLTLAQDALLGQETLTASALGW